jgi:hypothetical protein
MKLNEQQIGVVTQQHQQWLDNNITKYLLEIIEKVENRVVSELMSNSIVSSDTVVERQKQQAVILSVQLTTINNIKSIVKDTHKFINKLS